jgi:putative membrane protein
MIMWQMGEGWGWWMGFGSIWMVGFWAVIIWAVFTLRARWMGDHDRVSTSEGTALEILERRYARGDVSDEQYETMRARLSRSPEQAAV